MPLQLWIREGQYFFVDRFSGYPVQVGQAFREGTEGPWTIEVNDDFNTAPDLEAAKRLFVERYDRSRVKLSAGSSDSEEADAPDGFTISIWARVLKLTGGAERKI
jgi:hypothetical protein